MKLMKLVFLLLFLSINILNLAGQDTTYQVVFRTIPQFGQTLVKVDGVLTEKVLVNINPGQHSFSFWANGYHQKDTLIDVQGNINLQIKLKLRLEYIDYIREAKAYKKQALRKKFLPIFVSSGALAIGGGFYIAANKSQSKILTIIDKYDASRSHKEVISIKSDYEEMKTVFKRQRVIAYSAIGVGIAGGVIALIGNKSLKKKHKLEVFPKSTPFSSLKFRVNNDGVCLSKKF